MPACPLLCALKIYLITVLFIEHWTCMCSCKRPKSVETQKHRKSPKQFWTILLARVSVVRVVTGLDCQGGLGKVRVIWNSHPSPHRQFFGGLPSFNFYNQGNTLLCCISLVSGKMIIIVGQSTMTTMTRPAKNLNIFFTQNGSFASLLYHIGKDKLFPQRKILSGNWIARTL